MIDHFLATKVMIVIVHYGQSQVTYGTGATGTIAPARLPQAKEDWSSVVAE